MPNSFFNFKKFSINQDRCAMKVGTDGVVLGVTANFSGCSKIVDVGTGTGVVSLIVKQRFPDASVTAVEIDPDAAIQASENFKSSPWDIKTVCSSWQEFSKKCSNEGVLFDGVICNPPYFTSSLKNPSKKRTLARHNDSLPFSELISCTFDILSDNGLFYVIIPSADADDFNRKASASGLTLKNILYVHPVIDGAHKRVVLCFSKCATNKTEESHLFIETDQRKVYTPQFKELTKDFYL